MSDIPPPQVPPYRVTLFFGPETNDSTPQWLFCVFNVKKRSWKGGIQVVVNLEWEQLIRLRERVGFTEWLETWVSKVPVPEREGFLERGHDVLAQAICQSKLELAIQEKLRQENCELEASYLAVELEALVIRDWDQLKARLVDELDLPTLDSA